LRHDASLTSSRKESETRQMLPLTAALRKQRENED
jgi:hypothetical protein